MAISRVEINDFLVFKGEFVTDFCPGVNVLIGENGTGKTTLLKCLYAATDTLQCKTSRYFSAPGFVDSKNDVHIVRSHASYEFDKEDDELFSPVAVFFSSSDHWNRIVEEFIAPYDETPHNSYIGEKLDEGYSPNSQRPNMKNKSIMIPATEMLSHSKGFLALCSEWKMPFDQTQIDILAKAQLPETHEVKLNAVNTLDKIKAIIGGEVVYEDDTFFVQKSNGEKVSFSLEASGYKKLGLLWKLLRNGLLERGAILLWDEPENSISPELITVLVDVLLELSRNGVQIFIATHSELFASYFAVNRNKCDNVTFTSLYKDGEQIKANTSDRFDFLEPNNLNAEVVKLYKKELRKGLGGNG